MLDQRAADAATTLVVRNKQVLKIAVSRQSSRWIDGRANAPARNALFANHGERCIHRLDWVQEARQISSVTDFGDVHFVKSLIAFPQRKPNIKVVVINGFDLDRSHRTLLKIRDAYVVVFTALKTISISCSEKSRLDTSTRLLAH